ncbi:B12-binding domain-containing radical SAM protein [Magnetospirillum sulfuroxidans]|nr:cobalamin-dependent protein [Magnetospirillum sulfuroxidans]
MKTIKIALCDVRHATRGIHSFLMPIALGLLGAYAIKNVRAAKIDLRLYRSGEKFFEEFEEFQPDIVGCSFYTWNRSLTLHLLDFVKRRRGNTLTVVGSPELDIDVSSRAAFMLDNRQIDICVPGEGEITFTEIVQAVVDGKDPMGFEPIMGCCQVAPDGLSVVEGPDRPRLLSLDEVPSPYQTGLFDEFFADNLHPFIEPTRGCPFTCTFCRESIDMWSKVRFMSPERFEADLRYCADRLAGRHDVQLCLGDNNFGMYVQSLDYARIIRSMQDRFDWPRHLNTSSGKNQKERIVETSRILKWGLYFTMAAQSMHPPTLEAIRRKNISTEAMRQILVEVKNDCQDAYAELIVNLPLETRQTFIDGIRALIDLDMNRIIIMTLVMLKGTPLASQAEREMYGFKTCYRIIPRAFGRYNGETVVEIEEAVVATDTMSLDDYLEIRNLQSVINTLFNSDTANTLRRFLRENGVSIWDWIEGTYRKVLTEDSEAGRQMRMFAAEAKAELFESREQVQAFAESHYDKLLSGEYGDNLMNKYIVLANVDGFDSWLTASLTVGRELLLQAGCNPAYVESALESLRTYITMTYNFAECFDRIPEANRRNRVRLDFDVASWSRQDNQKLSEFAGEVDYDLWYSEEKVRLIRNILETGYDRSQTIQFVYRDRKYYAMLPEIERTNAINLAEA